MRYEFERNYFSDQADELETLADTEENVVTDMITPSLSQPSV